MPESWSHLVARFADVVTARALEPNERAEVRSWLKSDTEMEGFFAQSDADQRHGLASARAVETEVRGRIELVRAALLHDIGKRHSHLGVLSRSAASAAIRLGAPLSARWELYRDHGALSAAELAGAELIVVEFARHHHGHRPETISPGDWELLTWADRARVGR